MYTSTEAIANPFTVTALEARLEVENHFIEWSEFVAEMGDRATYESDEVLIWLGY